MKAVTDTVAGIVWELRRFTDEGNPVLYQSTYAKARESYGRTVRGEQVVPRDVFDERFVSGAQYDEIPASQNTEQGYLPGEAV